MAYDEALAERVREVLAGTGVAATEKSMFGGLAFLVEDAMAVAASGHGGLMVRCLPEQSGALTEQPGVARMVMRGREMDGWLTVEGTPTDVELERWVDVGVAAARAQPPKARRR
jgi:hypothetical protein